MPVCVPMCIALVCCLGLGPGQDSEDPKLTDPRCDKLLKANYIDALNCDIYVCICLCVYVFSEKESTRERQRDREMQAETLRESQCM